MVDDDVTPPGDFDVRQLVDGYVDTISAIPGIRTLYLVGSFGRDAADRWSDIDLLAVCHGNTPVSQVADDITTAVQSDLLMITRHGSDHFCLLNMIFPPWVRIDVSLTDNPAPQGSRMSEKRLVFGEAATEAMSSHVGDPSPEAFDHEKATEIVKQFARIFGLAPTVLGRGDLITARSGCNLLWGQLVELCLLETPAAGRMGALSSAQLLSSKHRALLLGLPMIENSRASLIAFHGAAWQAMLEVLAAPAFDAVERPSPRTLKHLQTWLKTTLDLAIDLP